LQTRRAAVAYAIVARRFFARATPLLMPH